MGLSPGLVLLPSPLPFQQEAFCSLDSSLLASLVSSATSPRERQRLNRVSQPHAGAWVSAVPSSLDGPDTLLRPKAFRVACRLRLGVAVWHEGASCPCCMHNLDVFGDHAICCTTSGDLIVRHNRIRDLVDKFAREGHLGPVLEKKGILGESSGRRPGDVSIPLWCEGKALAVDVAVTCPFSSSNLVRDSPAEYYAEHLKHRKYDAADPDSEFARCLSPGPAYEGPEPDPSIMVSPFSELPDWPISSSWAEFAFLPVVFHPQPDSPIYVYPCPDSPI